jgi:hypothetical protein
MRTAGGGAGRVRIGCWLLVVGCWISATSGRVLAQNEPKAVPPLPRAQSCGPVVEGAFKCPRFEFSYKVPFGWVDRTAETQKEDADEGAPSQSSTKPGAQKSAKSETLLAIFERPPGAPGETIDAAVVIAAEPLKNYPQVKSASDYFGPISELAEQRGFKTESEPYSFNVGAKHLVREEFSKQRGKLTMRQSSLVMIEKEYIVSFTFVSGSEDEAEDLIANLRFAASAQKKK